MLSAPRVGPAPLPSIYLVDYGISCRRGKAVIDHGFGGTLIYMVRAGSLAGLCLCMPVKLHVCHQLNW